MWKQFNYEKHLKLEHLWNQPTTVDQVMKEVEWRHVCIRIVAGVWSRLQLSTDSDVVITNHLATFGRLKPESTRTNCLSSSCLTTVSINMYHHVAPDNIKHEQRFRGNVKRLLMPKAMSMKSPAGTISYYWILSNQIYKGWFGTCTYTLCVRYTQNWNLINISYIIPPASVSHNSSWVCFIQ